MTERELFKEAVMQYLVDDAKAQRASKKRKPRPVARRILFAAACLLVAVSVTVFSIPSARAAVEEWINDWFSPVGYFGQEKEDRAKEPTIEAIITTADGNTAKVTEVGTGYEAYAEGFDMTLDEIAYDGETIFISGMMSGATARPFVEAQTGGDTFRAEKYAEPIGSDIYGQYCFCACENIAKFVTSDGRHFSGEIVPTFTDEMNAIAVSQVNKEKEIVFENGELVTSNKEADELWDAYLADHDVRFSIELQENTMDAQPLSGQVSGELSFRMEYSFVDEIDSVPLLKASFGSINIDATAYAAVTSTQAGNQTVQLSGVHRMFFQEPETIENSYYIHSYVKDLDMSGVSISVDSLSFTPMGLDITLQLNLPESWTRTERIAAAQGGESGGLDFVILVDGVEIRHAFLSIGSKANADTENKDDPFLTSPRVFSNSTLSRSQWDAVKTITFIPCLGWPSELVLEDLQNNRTELNRIRLDPGVTVTEQIDITGTVMVDWQEARMDDFALTINLDDYR